MFDQQLQDTNHNTLNLAATISLVKKQALAELPIFKGEATSTLCKIATDKMGGKRTISDRFTAMLIIAGTRYLDHPELQEKLILPEYGL